MTVVFGLMTFNRIGPNLERSLGKSSIFHVQSSIYSKYSQEFMYNSSQPPKISLGKSCHSNHPGNYVKIFASNDISVNQVPQILVLEV